MNLDTITALAEEKLKSAPASLQPLRQGSVQQLKSRGLKLNPELYKYTNVLRFLESMPEAREQQLDQAVDHLAQLPTFLFIDGELTKKPEIAGLKVSFALPQQEEKSDLTVLHHSFMSEALVLEVERQVAIKEPLRVLHLVTKKDIKAPTLIIRMNEHSTMTVVEETKGAGALYAQVAETFVTVASGARLTHLNVELGGAEALHLGSTWVNVKKDGHYSNTIFNLSGRLIRRNLDLKLLEAGAHGESWNLFLTYKNEQSDINTVIHHEAADTTSQQLAKGILGGESKGIFTGKIHIHQHAQRVASGQLNKNLLLSRKAQIHSQPQLEIFADDVKCSHGSTTGQLSPEEIFYFESRGLSEQRARTLLAHGFALEVVQKQTDTALRDALSKIVLETLKSKFKIGGDS